MLLAPGSPGWSLLANSRKPGVVVLEARERRGGRVWTDHRLGRNLEIGGTWLYRVQPHAWAEITRYGLAVTRASARRWPTG